MANLRVNLDTAVYAVLNVASVTNEATGGVYNTMAPDGVEPPFVVFQAMSKVDDYFERHRTRSDFLPPRVRYLSSGRPERSYLPPHWRAVSNPRRRKLIASIIGL